MSAWVCFESRLVAQAFFCPDAPFDLQPAMTDEPLAVPQLNWK